MLDPLLSKNGPELMLDPLLSMMLFSGVEPRNKSQLIEICQKISIVIFMKIGLKQK